MTTEMVKLNSLILDKRNPRIHEKRNLAAIKDSLVRFGQQKPVIVNEAGVVIAGNGTVMAAIELDWEDISIVRTTLKEAEALAFGIADNKTSELGEWDYQVVASIFKDLQGDGVSLEGLGFEPWEITPLLQADWTPPAPSPESGDFESIMGKALQLTIEQRKVIDAAIERVRKRENDMTIAEGRAIELAVADFLGGPA